MSRGLGDEQKPLGHLKGGLVNLTGKVKTDCGGGDGRGNWERLQCTWKERKKGRNTKLSAIYRLQRPGIKKTIKKENREAGVT